MEKTFETIVTDIGTRLIAQAAAEGKKIDIAYLAVGDGNGAYYKPVPSMTSLKNEKWRGQLNSASRDAKTLNIIDVVAVVPPDVGGWTIREMCILDTDENMIAICNTPDTEKTVAAVGAAGEIELTMQIKIANTSAISFLIDPNVITATKEDITRHAADTIAHITPAERATWNGRATTEDIARHAADTTAHMTQAQKNQLAAAVQSATIGGAAVTKNGTTLQLPAYPTTLPANGGVSANTTSVAAALTVSTAAPSSYIGDGKMWGVY